eukprot:TRINITY_DN64772_c0_g1_i1.p1 TRINITY_DN64772_c0_g1~~TRINITY_DN64772_c0_g1_i1.p1  ORF type:complete len:104 (+),score=0.92 TRINITY_DN64772_c0_g1_i1:111-422(+)
MCIRDSTHTYNKGEFHDWQVKGETLSVPAHPLNKGGPPGCFSNHSNCFSTPSSFFIAPILVFICPFNFIKVLYSIFPANLHVRPAHPPNGACLLYTSPSPRDS